MLISFTLSIGACPLRPPETAFSFFPIASHRAQLRTLIFFRSATTHQFLNIFLNLSTFLMHTNVTSLFFLFSSLWFLCIGPMAFPVLELKKFNRFVNSPAIIFLLIPKRSLFQIIQDLKLSHFLTYKS